MWNVWNVEVCISHCCSTGKKSTNCWFRNEWRKKTIMRLLHLLPFTAICVSIVVVVFVGWDKFELKILLGTENFHWRRKKRAISVQIAAISTEKMALFLFCFRIVYIEFNFPYCKRTHTDTHIQWHYLWLTNREKITKRKNTATFQLKTMRVSKWHVDPTDSKK